MAPKPEDLLDAMRQSQANWSRRDLIALYEGFGFAIKHGKRHDVVYHPKYPDLRATVPRHRDLAKAYFKEAVKLIDRLEARRRECQ